MFDSDLLLTFAFMAILFLRQIFILKQPNKINYSPLMLGIGGISTLVHFILHPDTSDAVLLIRESVFPFLVSLLLYIVMNILHQTQESEDAKTQKEFTKVLVNEISQLKEFILELETRMIKAQKEERDAQHEVRLKFKNDIKALDAIQINQTKVLDKFDAMEDWHKDVSKDFEYFSDVKLPELDDVVHKHIDILRVAEQDHYNKLNTLLERAVQSRGNMSEDIDELKSNLDSIKSISDDISKTIIKQTLQQLSSVTKSFESQMLLLKSHAEGVKMSLTEGDSTLSNIRTQSEMIMKQMVLSANKMNELQKQNSGLHDVYSTLKDVINDVENIKSDYVKSQAQLNIIVNELAKSKDEQVIAMKIKIDDLSSALSEKIDESLDKLHQHYHIAEDDITQSVQVLSKRAQLQKGYTEFDK